MSRAIDRAGSRPVGDRAAHKSSPDRIQIERFPLAAVLKLVRSSASEGRTFLIGVDGGAGAGKTTFTCWLSATLESTAPPVSCVHVDSFFRPSAERRSDLAVIADLDWERLRDQVLSPLRRGDPARFQIYEWPEDRAERWVTIGAGGVLIVDGIASTRRELYATYDLRTWLACPQDVRVQRLLSRGDTSKAEVEHWLPSEHAFIAADDPESRAHIVIDTTVDLLMAGTGGWAVKRWTPPGSA